MVSFSSFTSFTSFNFLLFLLSIFCASFISADEAIRRMSIVNRFMQRRMDMDTVDDQQQEQPHNLVLHRIGTFQKEHESNQENCGDDQYFDQILDHTNETSFATYKQRFQVNMEFFNASDSQQSPVVFLMIGGEGEIRKFWVCNERTGIAQMAKEHGAILVQLEHRFFGRNASAGLGQLTTENMAQLLTLDQALADIASFIPHFNRLHGLKNARWVAFGGSYPGSMAAWLRAKYPQLTIGAVASSAPIWPKVDFWEYSARMEEAIKKTSPACYEKVKAAFKQLANMIHNDKDKIDLDVIYEASPAFNKLEPIDLTNFLSTVFGAWQGIIQYTYDQPRRETNNLTEACKMMTDEPELQQGLYDVFWYVKKAECASAGIPEAKCKQNNFKYEETIKPMKDISIEGGYATSRAWIWMTCNEFGWYQTTDKENSIFGDLISMNFYYQICADLFGPEIGAKYVDSQVAKSLATLGDGCTFEASNVIMPNGRFDPWSELGIVEECRDEAKKEKDANNHLVSVWTEGAAHCADMYPPYEGEPEGLKLTREKIKAEVKYYLEASSSGAASAIMATGIFTLLLPLMAFLVTIPFGHFL